MRHRRLIAIPIVVLVAAWQLFGAPSHGSGPVEQAPIPVPFPAERPKLLGAGSCASAACHNSGDASKIIGREYALCIADKHSEAYAVLLEDRSKKIEQRLRGLPDWKSAQPERDVLCLKCHVHPEIDRTAIHETAGVRQFRLEDGVSCEACHGPAERWLDRHHRAEWKTLPASEKRDFGMIDTRGVVNRARACVECHVGDAGKGMEVNHDLLAAGHPRLAFEFTSYQSLMTRHWDDARDRDPTRGGNSDFEIEAWAKGQAVVLNASLQLLRQRAGKTWPEFAEFDCYSCHHDLRNAAPRPDRGVPHRPAGKLAWKRWPAAQAATALTMLRGPDPEVEHRLETLGREMTTLRPNKGVLDREIPKILGAVDDALKPRKMQALPIRGGMAAIIGRSPDNWDDAAQAYAALVAWEQARIDRRAPEVAGLRGDLEDLRRLLLPDARYHLKGIERKFADIQRRVNK